MRTLIASTPLLIIIAVIAAGCASEQYTQTPRGRHLPADSVKAMTMQDVITLSKNGVSDSLIIGMLDATDTWFRMTPQNVVEMKNAGVSDRVIAAMMEQPSSTEPPTVIYRYYDPTPGYWYGWYSPWYGPRIAFRYGHRPFSHPHRFR